MADTWKRMWSRKELPEALRGQNLNVSQVIATLISGTTISGNNIKSNGFQDNQGHKIFDYCNLASSHEQTGFHTDNAQCTIIYNQASVVLNFTVEAGTALASGITLASFDVNNWEPIKGSMGYLGHAEATKVEANNTTSIAVDVKYRKSGTNSFVDFILVDGEQSTSPDYEIVVNFRFVVQR